MRRLLTAAALVALLGVASPPALAGVPVGLSDQEPATFLHPLFAWTGIRYARVVTRWDIAVNGTSTERRDLGAWLKAAEADGVDPMVSFEHPRGEDCTTGPCRLPGAADYRAAIAAFHQRWPSVRTLSPWNEANHPSQPTATHPEAAAAYYDAVVSVCPECRVMGAEVLDSPNMEWWLRRYRQAAQSQPQLWALHNYGDVTRQRDTYTTRMLALVPGEVWLTETGGVVRMERQDGSVPWPYDEARARRSIEYAFGLADAHADRITRLYLYNWRSPPWQRWDSGLLSWDGRPRPGFEALAARLRPAQSPPPDAAAPPRTVYARVASRPRLSPDRRVRALLACPAAREQSCQVAMRVRGRRGKPLGDVAAWIRGGSFRVLRVRIARSRWRRLGHGRRCQARARIWLGGSRSRAYRMRCPRRR